MATRGYLVDRCPHCGGALRQRTTEKNAHLHAVLHQIAEQKQWADHWLDVEQWKRLFVAAFERERGRQVLALPALDGQGMDVVNRKTSRMTQEEIRDLIYFVESWALEHDVVLAAPKWMEAA